jgi:type IV secretion system protein VirB10
MAKKDKDNASPGFMAPKPTVKKAGKKALGLIAAAVIILLIVLMSGLSSQKEEGTDNGTAPTTVEMENKPLAPPMEGFGLTMPESPKDEEQWGKTEPSSSESNKYVGPPQTDPEEEARRREADEIRRRKFEREQQAYSSTLLVKRGDGYGAGGGSVDADGDGYIDQHPPYTPAGPDAYDPAADRDKEQFFSRSDVREWQSPYTREAGRNYEIKTGTVIPGVMVSGINSDLPGSLIAQVSQNVYDTGYGRHLLIPQGSKLYGVYDSRVVYGQSRVLIAWNRVIFPDGSAVTLGAMPGMDISGYAGFKDKVDNHYLRIFGSAIMMSLVSGGMSYAVDQVSNTSSGSDSTSVQDEMAAALAAQLGQTTLQLLQKNLNIKPTLEIRPGYQFNIIVTKDVAFRDAYAEK